MNDQSCDHSSAEQLIVDATKHATILTNGSPDNTNPMTIVDKAIEQLSNNTCIGLGSGRAARAFVQALGARLRENRLRVQGVATSTETEEAAQQAGVPLITLEKAGPLDLTVDGADEVDPHLNLIKGYGHALVREKIVAAYSKRLLILVGQEKLDRKSVV